MHRTATIHLRPRDLLLAIALCLSLGCQSIVSRPGPRLAGPQTPPPIGEPAPTEKEKTSLPPYVIGPPDVLTIEAVRVVPKPPYKLKSTDVLKIEIEGPPNPIGAMFAIDTDGKVDLGPRLGKVSVVGLTADGAADAIRQSVGEVYRDVQVSVLLYQSSALQPIIGQHLVAPDGRVNLGTYGMVYVTGMTVPEARAAIETHLQKYLDRPKVSVEVFSYSSTFYYVITQGAGLGDNVLRVPLTGSETVLDAVTQVGGISRMSSKNMWVARPAPGGAGCDTILPINWNEVTAGGSSTTNYQIMPGDRVFIAENKVVALGTAIEKMVSPFERVFGFSLLGMQTVITANNFPGGFNNGTGAGF